MPVKVTPRAEGYLLSEEMLTIVLQFFSRLPNREIMTETRIVFHVSEIISLFGN